MHLFYINGLVIAVALTVNMMFLSQPGFSGYKDKNEKTHKNSKLTLPHSLCNPQLTCHFFHYLYTQFNTLSMAVII